MFSPTSLPLPNSHVTDVPFVASVMERPDGQKHWRATGAGSDEAFGAAFHPNMCSFVSLY